MFAASARWLTTKGRLTYAKSYRKTSIVTWHNCLFNFLLSLHFFYIVQTVGFDCTSRTWTHHWCCCIDKGKEHLSTYLYTSHLCTHAWTTVFLQMRDWLNHKRDKRTKVQYTWECDASDRTGRMFAVLYNELCINWQYYSRYKSFHFLRKRVLNVVGFCIADTCLAMGYLCSLWVVRENSSTNVTSLENLLFGALKYN